jgi:hypothetical protein
VQAALLSLYDHSVVGAELKACYDSVNCTGVHIFASEEACKAVCYSLVDADLVNRCDTTPEVAEVALIAKTDGKFVGWRSTLSYMELRNMQEETDFINFDQTTGLNRCIRSAEIYDAIVCPPGHFRKSQDEVNTGCDQPGFFNCTEEGFQCLCSPCVKAFDVALFPEYDETETGCGKFDVCGVVEQTKTLKFYFVDNKARMDPNLAVKILEGSSERVVDSSPAVGKANFTYEFEFHASQSRVGIVIIEIAVDGEQIPESPFRLSVVERDCAFDTGDNLQVANDVGECICATNSINVGGTCVLNGALIPSIVVPLLVLLGIVVLLYVQHMKKNQMVFGPFCLMN